MTRRLAAVSADSDGRPPERKLSAGKNLTLACGPLTIETREVYLSLPV